MTKTDAGRAGVAPQDDFAPLWDTPDAKRERSPGKWDLYCQQCGRFVDSAWSPTEPHSVRCRPCREGWRCSRCGERAAGVHIDGEGFVCHTCLDRPLGHVAVPKPESPLERACAADAPQDGAEVQGGAAGGSGAQDAAAHGPHDGSGVQDPAVNDALARLSAKVQEWLLRTKERTAQSSHGK